MLPAETARAPGAPVVVARALTFAAVAVLAVAGCGDEDEDGGDDAPASEATELTITLDADGPDGDPAQTETATCDPGAGDSCDRLKATDLAPLDPATPCTEIYGGPDVAIVEGTLDGQEVSAALNRANGCEIERFDRFVPLLRELFPGYKPGAALRP